MMDEFLQFSAELTAFSVFELRGTGMADAYLKTVEKVVGSATLHELLQAYRPIATVSQEAPRTSRLRREILGDEKLGAIARNIIKLWYIGIWEPLPNTWVERYGPINDNTGFMVNAAAYTEGLLWVAIGANPPGAGTKAPGYASWTQPPQIPAF
jgi:hypothetical protein